MYKYIILLVGGGVFAQYAPIMINEGMLTISPKTEVSTFFDFENQLGATVSNDGTFYFYSDFNNEGLYTYDSRLKTSYAVFQNHLEHKIQQKMGGSAPTYFYDVLFNNPVSQSGFDLKNDISISGTANFNEGIVHLQNSEGAVVFEKGARHINTSDKSHVNGSVEKQGLDREIFTFPIGNSSYFRPAKIITEGHLKETFKSEYYFDAPPVSSVKADIIEWINDKEYWTIEREGGKNNIILALTWSKNTTAAELLNSENFDLHIVRWDSSQKIWIDEGGIVDKESQTVTTPTVVNEYGIFTLAKIKKIDMVNDVVIYNAVSPNGDGNNDYFFIENIQKFSNNSVQIYNRWGVKVFETINYDTNGNVFQGISEGRGTINKSEKLPSGTYYYIVNYEYGDSNGSRMIKKAGYLHLENN